MNQTQQMMPPRMLDVPTWPNNVWTRPEYERIVQEFQDGEAAMRKAYGAPDLTPDEQAHLSQMIVRSMLHNVVAAGCA